MAVVEAEPWVPARLVLKAYRDLQRHLGYGRNRPIGSRALALVDWFLAHIDEEGYLPFDSIRESWEQWKSENGGALQAVLQLENVPAGAAPHLPHHDEPLGVPAKTPQGGREN
jgi:hypothetical protein